MSQTRDPKLVEVEVTLKHLPRAFDGYRIVQISDLHIGLTIREGFARAVVDMTLDEEEAQVAVAEAVVEVIHAFHTTGTVPSCVNLARRSRANHVLVVRHRDRVGVLASVLEALRGHDINVQEMENRIFEGSQAASARISVTGPVSPTLIEGLLALPHILNVSAVPLESNGETP